MMQLMQRMQPMTSTRALLLTRHAVRPWLAALVLAAACSTDDPADDDALDAGVTETEAADTAGTDAASSDADTTTASSSTPDSTGDASSSDDTGPAELGAIAGSITRTAEPTGGGVGTVYVAVFSDNPITSMDAATLGQAVLEASDLTDPTTALTYLIEGLPARDEPYHVVAFLDDDANASMDAPGPDMGDLVTLDGTGTPTVVVTPGDAVPMNLVLNAVMPF
jgi:hypothetical protein